MDIGITERGDAALDLDWMDWVKETKPAILITKNPKKLHDVLRDMKSILFSPNVIVHCTITGWGMTSYEPHVQAPDISIEGYKDLNCLLGQDRVVLRIDPIIPTDEGERVAKSVFEKKIGRVRISFLDNYPHVKERFKRMQMEALNYDFHAPLGLRKRIWEEMGKPEICGEPGLPCTGCVSKLDCDIFGITPKETNKGQRQFCACLANKKELLSNKHTCGHKCIYCYWKDEICP